MHKLFIKTAFLMLKYNYSCYERIFKFVVITIDIDINIDIDS